MKRVCLILLFLLSLLPSHAQMSEQPLITWDDFLQEYATSETDDDAYDAETIDWLERLSQHPYQINRVERDQLLRLPFLDAAQVDSLLSYRQHRHGILSLGELQLIKGMDYFTRRNLSLFVRCDSLPLPSAELANITKGQEKILPKLVNGRHELETTLHIPFYQREGYKKPDNPTSTNYYVGNALRHIVRYRYAYKREVKYGLTMEKDAGEPVCKRGFYPYDYLSGYFYLRPKSKPWSLVVGDFNLRGSRGLVFGNNTYGSRSEQLLAAHPSLVNFRPHTSAEEVNFFRGAAAECTMRDVNVMLFASYRKLDARYANQSDTVVSLPTTGLHRTISEINMRRTLGCMTAGTRLAYVRPNWHLAINAMLTHYDHIVSPPMRYYNAYYFRGRTLADFSANYYAKFGKMFLQGELATDSHLHLATEHVLNIKWHPNWMTYVQYRQFSPRFVSIYGKAVQQASRVANEQGISVGTRWLPTSQWQLTGSIDCFRFPCPTYYAVLDNSKGIEALLQAQYAPNRQAKFLIRYSVKTKQYTLKLSQKQLLEYRSTHRLRLSSVITKSRYDLAAQLDAACATSQSSNPSWGWMCAVRAGYRPSKKLVLKGFYSLFFTDNYDTRLYAYEPQLPYASSFPSFAYHGTSAVLIASVNIVKSLTISARISSVYYFNRDTISSRLDLINSPFKNDLSIQLKWII